MFKDKQENDILMACVMYHEKNLSIIEIANTLNLDRSTIRNYINQNNDIYFTQMEMGGEWLKNIRSNTEYFLKESKYPKSFNEGIDIDIDQLVNIILTRTEVIKDFLFVKVPGRMKRFCCTANEFTEEGKLVITVRSSIAHSKNIKIHLHDDTKYIISNGGRDDLFNVKNIKNHITETLKAFR